MQYGQFCPVAKATEILGEKWTLLIVRELLMGGSRFNELQRGLSLISPTLLSKRLDALAARGLVLKRRIRGQRGFEYLPTACCRELRPVILALGDWGMRWARANLNENDYDIEMLMLYLKRSVVPEKLPGKETVLRFKFSDARSFPDWWLVATGDDIDLCVKDPGKEVDVYFTTSVKAMADIWMGEETYRNAMRNGSLKVVGPTALTRNIGAWMRNAVFADPTSPARE
jgi:DNA-binding HxlR family transcriptional regulator